MNKALDSHQAEILNRASHETGRNVEDILLDYTQLSKMPGRLKLEEYLRNGLHRPNGFSKEEREDFVSSRMHWPIVTRCCDMSWYGAVDDKWLCQTFLSAAGLPVPKTVAVVDQTQRHYSGTPTVRNVADMKTFLASRQGLPFFAKPIRGIGGKGAILCEKIEGDSVHVRGYDPLSAEAFFEALGPTPYMFQEILKNHADLQALSPNLATVRLIVFVYDDMVTLAFAILKVAGPDNVVDSALVEGNFVCSVADPEGTIQSMVSKTSTGRVVHKVHPYTGASVLGQHIPFWKEIRQHAARTASLFAPLRYQSMDIAVTAEGPVIVEVNAGGSLGMVQRATLRGFLQPHVRHFLKVCNIDLEQIGSELDALEQQDRSIQNLG